MTAKDKEKLISIQACITGYEGSPASLFSLYKPDSDVLAVSVLSPKFIIERREGAMLITNNDRYERDWMFKPDDFRDSIEAYFAFSMGLARDGKSKRLSVGSKATSADPVNALDREGFDERGPVYQVNESITNAQVAFLATALYAQRKGQLDMCTDFAKEIYDFQQQLIWTI